MKQFIPHLLIFCIPLLLTACEEGLFGQAGETSVNCLEIQEEYNTGLTIERVYNDRDITELRFLHNGELVSYYAFSYGSEGRIVESQFFDVANNSERQPQKISYNAEGKWVEVTTTQVNGDITTVSAVYDDLNQIQKLTSSTNRSGTVSVNYTVDFTWEAGNNTIRTFTSPVHNLVTEYEYDQNQINRRQKEQEKIAFLYTLVFHNKNMYSQVATTYTTDSTTSETVAVYNYQFNEAGYPVQLIQTKAIDSATPTVTESLFFYNCH